MEINDYFLEGCYLTSVLEPYHLFLSSIDRSGKEDNNSDVKGTF